MKTRMDVRHFFEVVRMWKLMALRNLTKEKKTNKKKRMHRESAEKENRQCLQES